MRTITTITGVFTIALLSAGCQSSPARQLPPNDPPQNAATTKSPAHLDPNSRDLERKIVDAHNKLRLDAKLPSLTVSPKLQAAAEAHALDMAIHKKMSHTGSNGSTSITRIKATGYNYRRAAENVAFGRFDTEALMKGWINSLPHKHNILGAYSQIGVGCAIAEDGKRYWCVTFGLPMRN